MLLNWVEFFSSSEKFDENMRDGCVFELGFDFVDYWMRQKMRKMVLNGVLSIRK